MAEEHETEQIEEYEVEQALIRTRWGVVRFPDKEEALDVLYQKYPRIFQALYVLADTEGIVMLLELSRRFPQEFFLVARAVKAKLRPAEQST